MKTSKKGISLIVLVITIIIMIILAAAIILSLNSSGIIDKANEAKNDYSAAQYKEAAMVAMAELELEDGVTASNLEANLKEKFGDNTTVKEENGNYVITVNGHTVTVPTNTQPETFTFEFLGGMYTAEVGMTWAEWVFSEYNTRYDNTRYGIYNESILVFEGAGDACVNITFVYDSSSRFVHQKPTDVISIPTSDDFDLIVDSAGVWYSMPSGTVIVDNPNI